MDVANKPKGMYHWMGHISGTERVKKSYFNGFTQFKSLDKTLWMILGKNYLI